ncbi:MAG: histidine kinase dimerization/phospho-acceptor domain-containing protein [Thermoproteota archaeon]
MDSHKIKEIEQEKEFLEELNNLYEKLNNKNSNLLSSLNQEIRTPLVLIKSYTDMLLDDQFGTITQIQRDKLILMSKSIDSLIQAVLDVNEQRFKNS